jgi:hypothetical protein
MTAAFTILISLLITGFTLTLSLVEFDISLGVSTFFETLEMIVIIIALTIIRPFTRGKAGTDHAEDYDYNF